MSKDKRKSEGGIAANKTAPKQLEAFCFKPGQSGNPNGRPKGSRNKLGEDFLADLHEAWEKHGKRAIEKVAEARPDIFLKVVASVLPKEQKASQENSIGQSMDRLLDIVEE